MASVITEAYGKIEESAPEGFVINAFFPWVFVLFIHIVIYELWIPDGNSLADRFLTLEENDQLYVAIGVAVGLAGLAAATDLIAREILMILRSKFLGRHFHDGINDFCDRKGLSSTRSKNLGDVLSIIEIELVSPEPHPNFLEGPSWKIEVMANRGGALLQKITERRRAVRRNLVFIIGLTAALLYDATELGRYQPDIGLAAIILITLWLAVTIPTMALMGQLRSLAQLDLRSIQFLNGEIY